MNQRLAEFGPLIDAADTRTHVARLREHGLSVRTISRLSGVSMKALASIVWGVDGRAPNALVRQDTADRLFAVRPRLELLDPLTKVGSTGTRRRLQALQVVGWSQRQIASRLRTNGSYIGKVVHGHVRHVQVRTALAVRRLYDELWDVVPPMVTAAQRGSVTRVRQGAARLGWVPPLAWDDDTIDDPAAVPEGAGYVPPALGKLPEPAEVRLLVQGGDSLEVLAGRYGVNVKAVQAKLARAKKEATA
jgi:hypothetical protein